MTMGRIYIEQAQKTETIDFAAIGGRLKHAQTIRLLHSILGISSEIGELANAFCLDGQSIEDGKNAIEEIGDIFWFTAIGANALYELGLKGKDHNVFEVEPEYAGVNHMRECSDVLVDAIKAHIFYGRALDLDRMFLHMQGIVAVSKHIAKPLGYSPAEIMNANIRKLQDKQKGRYKNGFTENAANNRNTKAELEALEQEQENEDEEFLDSLCGICNCRIKECVCRKHNLR